jgi:photosystem II stability/assembly factor-like uncharacterized protein
MSMGKMYSLWLVITISFFQHISAQSISFEKDFKNLKARSIGPAGMSGRVTTIDAVHATPDIIYIGAASGGVWKTTSGGAQWEPVFDEQPIQNIGAIAIQQSNPSVVWVGTGEGNPRNSINLGAGIYKTMDGGKTWKLMGLEKTVCIHRIIIHPTNPDIVYVGAIGNPFASHPERGVFKTTDGGKTWQKILFTNEQAGVGDMVMDPSNPYKIVVNMWNHRRTPWSFSSNPEGGGMYITWDGGETWKKMGKEQGLPDTTGRMGFAIAKSDPNVMYAMIESTKNALYRTEDGGFKWEKVNEDPRWVTNRPFYFQDIAVDPTNENRLYNIYQMIAQSDDGGRSFRIIIPYSGVHPDHHAWWIHPYNPNFIINGNDGGIAVSRDRGRTWQFDEKLPLGQFYHINVDNEIPYNVMGGLQDNGSWHGPAYVWAQGGIRNSYWQSVGGGDGFDVIPDPDDSQWVYSMSQGGNLGRMNRNTGERWAIRPPSPDPNLRLRFNWNAPFAQDPFDNNTIYYGSQFVHKSANKGAAWSIISPDLTTNDPEKQKQDENGGLTIDITNAENHCTILAIEPSKKEAGVIWVATDDGQVQLTRDAGKTWSNLTANIKGMPKNAWIQQVRTNKFNAGEAVIVVNNYSLGDMAPYIFRTLDYGKTWTRLVDDKKVRGYALSYLQDPVEPNLMFVGTEHGLWISLDGGNSFRQFTNGYPQVSTYDLAIQEREGDLAIATFGRSLYIIDDIRPLRAAASKTIGSKPVTVMPAPVAYQAQSRGPSGIEYSTYGVYAADNRESGAAINFFYRPKPDTAATLKADSAIIKIINGQGEAIRTFRAKADSGFNRAYWNYQTKGVRLPQQPKPRPNAPEPGGGFPADPGTYKVMVTIGKDSDSTELIVKYDPRISYPEEVRRKQRQYMDHFYKMVTELTEANDLLTDMDDGIKKVETLLKDEKGTEADGLRKSGKAIQDSIKLIREFMFGKRQEKQGYGTAYQLTVQNKINESRQLVMGKNTMPGEQEERAMEIAQNMSGEAIRRVNALKHSAWKEYKEKVGKMNLKLLKD